MYHLEPPILHIQVSKVYISLMESYNFKEHDFRIVIKISRYNVELKNLQSKNSRTKFYR